MKIGHKIDICG